MVKIKISKLNGGKNEIKIGAIAFLIGIGGSLLLGLLAGLNIFVASDVFTWILVIAGIVVGYMNIRSSESIPYGKCLIIGTGAGVLSILPFVGEY